MPSKSFDNRTGDASEKKNQGFIYYWYASSLLFLNALESDMHKHYPIEVYIGLDDVFQANFGNGWCEYRAVIIDSNQPHQISGGNGCLALILLDPNFYELKQLQLFDTNKYYQPSNNQISMLLSKLKEFSSRPHTCTEAKFLINEIISSLFGLNSSKGFFDPRINSLLNKLQHISQEKITIDDLAQAVNLSESRLAHLFKEQTGTPIRRYVLWLKLRRAIKMIIAGSSFTNAAHQSGFADSAHLSRTYRQMFGISPSELLKSYQSISIKSSYNQSSK